ncbi:MAG: hypothetical protein P8Y36_05755, partial [Alphaproteobacteria bacterium]
RIGGVLGSTFNVYMKNIVPYTVVAGAVLLPVSIVLAFAVTSQDPANPTGAFVGMGLGVLLSMILSPISTAVILYSAFQDMRGKTASLGEAISWALNRFLPLLFLGIVYALGVMAGFIALIIPGYILMVMWAVAVPACVVESSGPIDSLSRSSELTKGYRWQILGIVLIFGVLSGLIGNIVQSLGAMGGVVSLMIVMIIWQGISQAFYSVLMAVMYHDLRTTKEGGDVNTIASVFD